MPLSSDLYISHAKFNPNEISKKTADLNASLTETMNDGPRWYEATHQVGAEKYRQMRWNGETALPKPVVIDSGVNFGIPSRDTGRDIPCRVFKPDGHAPVKAVYMHIHGGGWVLQSEAYQDTLLKFHADACNLAVISVGYRLAPEHPFPAGPEDCYDAAAWLCKNARANYGADLMFMGGESAGAHLTVLTALHLLRTMRNSPLKALLLHYGCYDLSFLPSVHNFRKSLVLDGPIMERYRDSFLPGKSVAECRDPAVSPFYADLTEFGRGGLPSALFTCGTEDPLIDDTVMMACKWMSSGSEAVTKLYPGAPHGFTLFPRALSDAADEGLEVTNEFILDKLQ
ncbi:hypothetical protein K490DRAFT_43358 [Saccharata proteae CBS 121410]|uniref:Alpha/beta hydrolase fold-3 domain-containing protein n=1 Tax=Saccharata proteae CBS 121410 TaxID=1314787 RepID=A0A9P4HS61_9PEZI|nr:hypothetical protein K490DRAFT_43358 [Saccharata proteae CBS 121410]